MTRGTLDEVRAKQADRVSLHGGGEGAEVIAATSAENRRVAQVVFKPDWKRHSKAAPFRRNDTIPEQGPIGVIYFPGGSISDNHANAGPGLPLRVAVWARRAIEAVHARLTLGNVETMRPTAKVLTIPCS